MNLLRHLSRCQADVLRHVAKGILIPSLRNGGLWCSCTLYDYAYRNIRESGHGIYTHEARAVRNLLRRGLLVEHGEKPMTLGGDAIKTFGHLVPVRPAAKRVIKMSGTRAAREQV